jgi:peptidyl-prolyl cis-trans isomerase D
MLRTFHRFQRHLSGIILILAIVLAMSGFGIRIFEPKQNTGAIMVDDKEISFSDFYREVRNTEQQYRRMLGKNFDQFAAQLGINVPEQVKDRLIAETLMEREAQDLGMRVGESERREAMRDQIFPSGFDKERYKALLDELNMSQQEFEKRFSNNLLRVQYTSLLKDASRPSDLEARKRYERSETKYAVRYLEFDPTAFEKNEPAPSAEDIQKYYDEHPSDFELPARAAYDYVVFRPEDFLNKVQVQQDEVDFMYTDAPSKYSTPEMLKARVVKVNLPADKDPKKTADARKKAEDVFARAKGGTPFNLLAVQFSDDAATKGNGGDLGWIARGKMPPEFDAEAFKVSGEGVADLAVTDTAIYIIKVEGHKLPELKKKEDVQQEIETEIRQREAPAYASSKAQDVYDHWTKTKEPLAEIAKANGLKMSSTQGLLNKDQDPESALKNLTNNVLDTPEDQKEVLVELPAASIVVAVKERKDVEVQPLAAVKAKIVEILSRRNAKTTAQKTAEEALRKVVSGQFSGLDVAAKTLFMTAKEEKDLSESKQAQGLFGDRDMRRAIFSITKAGSVVPKVLEINKKFYLAQVLSVTPPGQAPDADTQQRYAGQAENTAAQTLTASILARARFDSKIDVSPAVLAR